jgi:cytochrome c oxidase subunit 3
VRQSDLTMGPRPAGPARSSPLVMPTKKLAMWLFLIADALTFAVCLLAYGFLRNGSANWPTPFKFFPTAVNAMVMTFILITSSLTISLGVRAAKIGDQDAAFRWTMFTAAGGAVFALLQIREWMEMVDQGMRLLHNPWGNGLFGATFFSITGLHLAHVSVGIIVLIIVGMRCKSGRSDPDDVEITGLYWQFVNLVWMFVVPFVYLLNVSK